MNETKTRTIEYPNIDKDFWEQIKKDIQEINKGDQQTGQLKGRG